MRVGSPGLLEAAEAAVPGITRARAVDRLGLAHDASHYLLTPQAVLTPRNADQVAALMRDHAMPPPDCWYSPRCARR
jgi:D-lactate dehydrogenase